MQIDVLPASSDQATILANLMELYIYDFSAIIDLKPGPAGRFGYDRLPLYWTEAKRFPFLVRVEGYWAGFVLVQQGSQLAADPQIWDMAEFFVMRGYRRQGVGVRVARQIWQLFPGPWEVRVSQKNLSALAFWQQSISTFIGKPAEAVQKEVAGTSWQVFAFCADGHKAPLSTPGFSD